MIGLNFKLIGARSAQNYLKSIPDKLKSNTYRSMERIGLILVREVKEQLSKGPKDIKKKGPRVELYKYKKNPTPHLRVRTGRLRQSVTHSLNYEGKLLVLRVGPQRVQYARKHELGIKVKARPYLKPAIKEKRRVIEQEFERGLNRAIQ